MTKALVVFTVMLAGGFVATGFAIAVLFCLSRYCHG